MRRMLLEQGRYKRNHFIAAHHITPDDKKLLSEEKLEGPEV
jgi:hypothetical protein